MNKIVSFFLTLSFFIASSSVNAGLEDAASQKALNEALASIQKSHNIPTLSVAVIDGGEFVYTSSFGEFKHNATEQAPRLRVASITKLFTAQAIMQLVELGIVQLDDLVSRYIEQFDGSKTTVEDLLTHGSGLKDVVRPSDADEGKTFDDYLSESLAGNAPSTLATFQYADINYNILGKIVEEASGVAYVDYVHTNIIERLGLKNTGFYQTSADFVEPEPPNHNYGIITQASERPYDVNYAPSEGLISTASDMAIWALAVLTEHPALLSVESYRDMQTPRGKTNWGELQIALGWQVLGYEIMQLAQHAGGITGYKALVISYPLKKRAIVVMANAGEVPRWGIAQAVNQAIDGQDIVLPESSQGRYRLILVASVLVILGVVGFLVWRRSSKKTQVK
ncbi:class A beta-lactamase-related serine hydrolase [Alteromonadaceae bacterium M269]|nr:class A beta-lactamase-related serine hydrolase [Alteromonadaceae bacterium M269]